MKFTLVKPAHYVALFQRLTSFVRDPVDRVVVDRSPTQKMADTIGLVVIKLLLFVAIAVVMALLSPVFDPKNVSIDNITERFSPIALLFVAG